MANEKKMIALPDNIDDLSEEEMDRLVDDLYEQLFGSDND